MLNVGFCMAATLMNLGTCVAALKWWLGSARQLKRGWFWSVWKKASRSKNGGAQGEEGSSFWRGILGRKTKGEREERNSVAGALALFF